MLSLLADQNQPAEMLLQRRWDDKHEPMCSILHPGHSCQSHWISFVLNHMRTISLKFYLPLNIISTLVFNRAKLISDPRTTSVRVAKSVFRSACFLSLYCGNAWFFQCIFRRLGVLHKWFVPFAMAFASGLTILIEEKSRRLELAMYCLSPTLQALYNLALQSGFVKRSAQKGHVVQLFCIAMGVIMTGAFSLIIDVDQMIVCVSST